MLIQTSWILSDWSQTRSFHLFDQEIYDYLRNLLGGVIQLFLGLGDYSGIDTRDICYKCTYKSALSCLYRYRYLRAILRLVSLPMPLVKEHRVLFFSSKPNQQLFEVFDQEYRRYHSSSCLPLKKKLLSTRSRECNWHLGIQSIFDAWTTYENIYLLD